MGIRRTSKRHTAGVVSADYWDFQPGQHVQTVDGFPGVVQAVLDGPYPGSEEYEVTLDGGMGGGSYTASDLSPIEGTTASTPQEQFAQNVMDEYHRLTTIDAARDPEVEAAMDLISSVPNEAAQDARVASGDYPELAEILVTRPPLAHAEPLHMRATKTAEMEIRQISRTCDVCHQPATGPAFGGGALYPFIDANGAEVFAHLHCGDGMDLDEDSGGAHEASKTAEQYERHPDNYQESVCAHCDQPIFWIYPRPKTFWSHLHSDSPICAHQPGFKAEPKTAVKQAVWVDTPASDALLDAASGLVTAANDAMEWVDDPIAVEAAGVDWDRLYKHFECEACDFSGDLDPVIDLATGQKVDICPRCGNRTPYEEIGPDGWPLVPSDDRLYQPTQRAASTDKKMSAEQAADEHVFFATAGLWDKVLNHGADFLNSQMKPEYQVQPGTSYSYDWCRFRKNERCRYPKVLDAEGTKEAGYAVWKPEDRGLCPRNKWDEQKACPVSEPGPHSGDPKASVDATVSWEDGGQRPWGPGGVAPNDYRASLLTAGFEVTAAWADVRAKAKRIRSEGGVRIISAPRPGDETLTVTAEINGDHHVYETTLLREPGKQNVASWRCGCAWASYAWGRSPAYKRFEGRMCSHALALQYEAQSQGMFGRTITEQSQAPAWREGNEPFTYVKPDRGYTRAASLVVRGSVDHPVYDDSHFDVSPLTYIAASGGLSTTAAGEAKALDFGGRLKALVRGTVKAIKFLVVNDMHRWDAILDDGSHIPADEILYPTYHPTRGLTVTHSASVQDVAEQHDVHHHLRHVEMPGGGAYPYDRPWFDPSQWGAAAAMSEAFLFEDGGIEAEQGNPETAASYEASTSHEPTYLTLDRARVAATADLHDEPEPALPSTDGTDDDHREAVRRVLAMTIGITPTATPDQAADELLNWAHQHDALITGAVRDVCDATDGAMDTSFLPLRIKGRPRMVEKIKADVAEKHLTPAQVAMRFSDALRFTVLYSTQDYATKTAEFLRQMATRGFRPDSPDRVKNFWLRDDPYDGVNSVLRGPDGFPFEVQFHTDQSMGLKNAIHGVYEEFRGSNGPTTPERRRELWDHMINAGATVERPTKEYDIGVPTRHRFSSTGEVYIYYAFLGDVPGEYNGVFRRVESDRDVRFERYSVSEDRWVTDNTLARHLVHGSIDVDPVDELTAQIIVNTSRKRGGKTSSSTQDVAAAHTEALVVEALVDPETAPVMAEAVAESLVEAPPGPGDPRLSWLMTGGASGGTGTGSGTGTPQNPSDNDIAAQAKAFLAKQALKTFSPAEQAAIINEGLDVQAANLGDLDIAGTHYEGLEAAFAAAEEEDEQ